MAYHIDSLQTLNVQKRDWCIQVRAIRVWKQPSFYSVSWKQTTLNTASDDDESLEVVFVDRTGTRIQATINSVLTAKFEQVIQEEESYIIRGFTVLDNKQKRWKAFDCNFKICFQYKTVVYPFESPVLPTYGLKLREFNTVVQVCNDNEFLIGLQLVDIQECRWSFNGPSISPSIGTRAIEVYIPVRSNKIGCRELLLSFTIDYLQWLVI